MALVPEDGDVQARVGEWSRTLTTPELLEAFTATISYWLEPGGRGTRFPLLVDRLLAGRLEAAEAAGARLELEAAARELAAVHPSRVVASLEEPQPVDLRDEPVDHEAESVASYFLDREGRPLVEVLREAIEECGRSGHPLTVDTGPVRGGTKRGALLTMTGALLTGAGLLVFPDVLAQPLRGEPGHGLPLWTFGLILTGAGLWELALGRSPALAALVRRRPSLPVLLGLALLSAVAILSYR